MSLAENLKRARQERKLSQGALAVKAKVGQQLISQIEAGINLSTKKLPQIARALGMQPWDLDENYAPHNGAAPEESKLPKSDEVKVTAAVHDSSIAPPRENMPENSPQEIDVVSAAQLMGEQNLPVFGTVQGGGGVLIVSDAAVSWVLRPDPLLRVKDGYGVIVASDRMGRYPKRGSTVIVNPILPWNSEDICIFRSPPEKRDNLAHILELISYTDDEWQVRQYNPPKDFTLKRSEWPICHVVVTANAGR